MKKRIKERNTMTDQDEVGIMGLMIRTFCKTRIVVQFYPA